MDQFDALARAAYKAYREVIDHKNYQGLATPTFDDLNDMIKRAWVAAANRAIEDYILRSSAIRAQLGVLRDTLPIMSFTDPGLEISARVHSSKQYDPDGRTLNVTSWWEGGEIAGFTQSLLESLDLRWAAIEGDLLKLAPDLVFQFVAVKWSGTDDIFYLKRVSGGEKK